MDEREQKNSGWAGLRGRTGKRMNYKHKTHSADFCSERHHEAQRMYGDHYDDF